MESNCFPTTSSSFTKAFKEEFSHSSKFASMKKGPNLVKKKSLNTPLSYSYNKSGGISPITCEFKSSSLDDNSRPSTNTDWRSFRARLVASELSSGSGTDHSPNQVDPSRRNDLHPHVKSPSVWAHIIHEPEKGCLLVATNKFDGNHTFESTAILILSTDSTGPTGIILNKPSEKEPRSTVPDAEDIFSGRSLSYGGPLDEKLVLVGPKRDDTEMVIRKSGSLEQVMEGVYFGTERGVEFIDEMVKRSEIGDDEFRVFEGYCWWEKNKLKEEIRDGFWKVIACSPSIFTKMD